MVTFSKFHKWMSYISFISLAPPTTPPTGTSGSILRALNATGDVFLEDSFNKNYHNFLIVGLHPGYNLKRSLLRFEDIPPSCQFIASARMHVHYWYAHKASFMTEEQVPWIPRPIQARQVLRSWIENQATRDSRYIGAPWNEQYLDLNNIDANACVDDTQTISRSTSSGYIVWDITTTAQNWLAGQPNHGILLMASNEDENGREIRFHSRESSPDQAPYLEVTCVSAGKVT